VLGLALVAAAHVGLTSITGAKSRASFAQTDDAAASTGVRSELVFSAWATGRATVYRIRPDGSGLRALTDGLSAAFPAVSPDGRKIATTSTARLHPIYVMGVDGRGRSLLVQPGGAPSWSPDGTRIAYSLTYPPRKAGVYIVGASGGAVEKLPTRCPSHAEAGGGPSWSPDGSKIVYSCARTMWLMNSDGTGAHMIARGWSFQPPAWSPDGTKIAFLSPGRAHVILMNVDGTGLRRLAPRVHYKNQDCNVAWSPDGSRLAFSPAFGGGIYFMRLDGTHLVRLNGVPSDACGISWRLVRG
jgi:TolB protein